VSALARAGGDARDLSCVAMSVTARGVAVALCLVARGLKATATARRHWHAGVSLFGVAALPGTRGRSGWCSGGSAGAL
jgi:hypothetical protein